MLKEEILKIKLADLNLSLRMLGAKFVITYCTLEKQYMFEEQGVMACHNRIEINKLGYMRREIVRLQPLII